MLRDAQRRKFLLINVFGGIAVLASYAWGALAAPDMMGSLWGGVPEALRPFYTVNMLLAAAGYFLFAPYIALRVETERDDFLGRFGYSTFGVLFVLVLIPSALWLPLTALMLTQPSAGLWALVRIDLFLVAVGSIGIFISLCTMQPPRPKGWILALVGLIPFCVQTAILDALVWPDFFNQ